MVLIITTSSGILDYAGCSGLLVKPRRLPGSKIDSTEYPPCLWGCCMLNHALPASVVRKYGEGVPYQMSSTSDRCCSSGFCPFGTCCLLFGHVPDCAAESD
ncbi:hypothetical protein AVEN_82963-1 [Araneus ventricosus]|uniref:Uncharacterized protein n=1 Tax=Araneus ventricosus TaxID=182803 RepID=A0A4Y2I292_ARAVE|nr:hypothetical protein AVEN_82963-1 [Araneus ventricosus]